MPQPPSPLLQGDPAAHPPAPAPGGSGRGWNFAALLSGALALGLGLALAPAVFALAAWATGHGAATALGLNGSPVAPGTALAVILLSLALALKLWRPADRTANNLALLACLGAACLCLLALPGPGDLFNDAIRRQAVDSGDSQLGHGRMSPYAAGALLLSAFGQLLFVVPRGSAGRLRPAGLVAVLCSGFLGVVILMDYVTGTQIFNGGAVFPVALLVAVSIVGLDLAILAWMARDLLRPGWAGAEGAFAPSRMETRLLGIFAGVVVCVVATGFVYLRLQRAGIQGAVYAHLQTIVELKARQLTAWRSERHADVRFFSRSPIVAQTAAALLANPGDRRARATLEGWVNTLRLESRSDQVFLLDPAGRQVSAWPAGAALEDPDLGASLRRAFGTGEAFESDLHRDRGDRATHIDLVAPVFSGDPARPLCAFVVRINPRRMLQRLLQNWPMPNGLAETVLARPEGGALVLASDLNDWTGSLQALSRLAPAGGPADERAGAELVDERGIRVLAAQQSVAGTPWTLVTTVEERDLYGPLRRQTWFVSLVIALLLTGAASGLILTWRQGTTALLFRELEAERASRTLAERLSILINHATDVMILIDLKGRIVEANVRAEQVYGYSIEELRTFCVDDLGPGKRGAQFADLVRRLERDGGTVVFEVQDRHKDGRVIPTEISAALVEVDGSPYVLEQGRDISQRRLHEREIDHLNRLYSALSHVNKAVVRINNRDELCNRVCTALVDHGGFRMVWIGWLDPGSLAVTPIAWKGDDQGYLEGIRVSASADEPEGRGPAGICLRERRPCIVQDFMADPRTTPWREVARRMDLLSCAGFPVRKGPVPVAALMVYANETGFFGAQEVELLEEVSLDLSFALQRLDDAEDHRRAEETLKANERNYREIFNATSEAIFLHETDGTITDVNQAMLSLYGYASKEEVISGGLFPLIAHIPPYTLDLAAEHIRRAFEEGPQVFPFMARRRDGTVFWVEVSLKNSEIGGKGLVLAVVRDITERRRAEDALRQSEDSLRRSQEVARLGSFTFDLASGRWSGSAVLYDIFGITPAYPRDVAGWLAIVAGPDRSDLNLYLNEYVLGGRNRFEREYRICRVSDGSVRWVSGLGELEFGKHGEAVRLIGTIQDVTERRRSEDALRQKTEELDRYFTASLDLLCIADASGHFLRVNPEWEHTLGHPLSDVEGRRFIDFVHPDDLEVALVALSQLSARHQVPNFTNRYRCADGTYRWMEWRAFMRDDRIYAVARDITARMIAEEKIREQAALLDTANDGIYVRDLEGEVLYWNRGAERLYGWTREQAVGRRVHDLFRSERTLEDGIRAALLERGSWSGERPQIMRSGQPITVFSRLTLVRDAQDKPRSVLAINTDITEKKTLETRFLRAQRLEGIGALAGGIAHDLNNVLAPIMLGIPLLREDVRGSTGLEMLAAMEASAQRGADIVKQVLTFARGIQGERTPLQARYLLRDMAKIAAETFPKNIRVENLARVDTWPVKGDATQLHQAILNLCVNARDALPDGGTVTLEADDLTLGEAEALQSPGARCGPYVRVRVTDSGTGIAPDIQEKIFEPFFTTKPLGKGTGLGLSTVLGIVRSHDGFVRVRSEPGKGSVFELFLPASPEARVAEGEAPGQVPPRGRGECILVVDDELAVRDMMRRLLEGRGYRVLTASHGADGLELFERNRAEVAAVVTDMMMPVMDGPALVRALRAQDPALRIVGMSGVGERAAIERIKALSLAGYLPKPFQADKLLGVLRDVLAGRTQAPAGARIQDRDTI